MEAALAENETGAGMLCWLCYPRFNYLTNYNFMIKLNILSLSWQWLSNL